MRRHSLYLSVLCVALMGCSMITEPGASDSRKECTLIGFTSQISISIQSDFILPEYFSAVINDEITVDECTVGNPSRYTFRRHNDHNATLTLFLAPGSPIADLFLRDGQPLESVELDAEVSGRDSCEYNPNLISHIQKPLKWVAVNANGEACGVDGYSGF